MFGGPQQLPVNRGVRGRTLLLQQSGLGPLRFRLAGLPYFESTIAAGLLR